MLPNLQADLSQDVDSSRSGFWLRQKDDMRLWCDTRFQVPVGWQGTSVALEAALHGWFR